MMNLMIVLILSIIVDCLIKDIFVKKEETYDKNIVLIKSIVILISLLISLLITSFISVDIYIKYLILCTLIILTSYAVTIVLKIENDSYWITSILIAIMLSINLIELTALLDIILLTVVAVCGYIVLSYVFNNLVKRLKVSRMPKCFISHPIMYIILGVISIIVSRYLN